MTPATNPNETKTKDQKSNIQPLKVPSTGIKRYLPIIIIIAVVIIAAGVFLFLKQPSEKVGNANQVQKLVKKPLVVGDIEEAFTLKAEKQDTLGVLADSKFILQSKNKIVTSVLKASLVVSPSFGYKIESSDNNNFTIVPEKPLGADTIYSFSLQAAKEADETQKRDYSWAYQIKDKFNITGTIPSDKTGNIPTNTGIEISFSSENYYDYEKYIHFTPNIKGRFEQHNKVLAFVPDKLSENTFYTVKIDKGLPVTGSQDVLEEDYTFSFATGSQYGGGELNFQQTYYEYPTNDAPVLTIYDYSQNGYADVEVNIWRFNKFIEFEDAVNSLSLIPSWAYEARRNAIYPTDSLIKDSSFKANIETNSYYQKYFIFPDKLTAGQYLVEVIYGQNKKTQAFLQISDLTANYYGSKGQGFIWLHDLITKKPLSGATVTFSGDSNLKNTTNDDGLATFETPDVLKKSQTESSRDYHFVIDYQNNKLLIPADTSYGYYYDYSYGGSALINDYWAYSYTNRSLYMPTDTIKFWGLAKKREGENIKDVRVVLKAMGYYGQARNEAIDELKAPISGFGTFQGEIKYENLTPGTYSMTFYAGDTIISTNYVEIQTYTKPAYKIDIETEKKAIFTGENVVFNIKTDFFDGTPVANIKLKYSGDFGDGNLTTDANGQGTLTFKTSYSGGDYYPRYHFVSVYPDTAELSVIESYAYVYVFGPRETINVSAKFKDNQGVISGTVNEITLDKINSGAKEFEWDYKGNLLANAKVNLKIYYIYYDKIEIGTNYDFINKQTYKTYRYEQREKLEKEDNVVTGKDGSFQYSFSADQKKEYRVEARTTDSQNLTASTINFLSAYSSYYYNMYDSSTYYLELNKAADQGQIVYKTDELVSATMKKGEETLSATNDKNFLYFKDHNGIFDVGVSNQPSVSFNFLEGYAPNIDLHAIYFDGRVYREAVQSIYFDKKLKQLDIKIAPDKDEYEPGEKAKIDINVTDANNQPALAEVNVSIIDQALAAIQWSEPLDILSRIYQAIPTSITSSYATDKELLMPGGAERGGCFGAGTKILMANGQEKNIEDIMVGEQILTKVSGKSNKLVNSKVLDKKEHVVSEYWVINRQLKVTPIHIVYLNGQWQPIGQAKVGDYLLNSRGEKVVIKNIEVKHQYVKVYNLTTEDQHTFLADGFYVHNEKGGARQNFQDVAYFNSVETDKQGNAQVSFTLPDNITSWQVTTQAVTKDLQAAGVRDSLIVTKPFFVDLVMPENYLASDKPTVKLRGFGKVLNPDDQVNFTVNYPDRKDVQPQTYTVKAFEKVEFSLPDFTAGEHSIKVQASSTLYEDIIIKKFTVRDSNLLKNKVLYYLLSDDWKPSEDIKTNAILTLTSKERGQYYSILRDLTWTWGDRLDQKLARRFAEKYLNDYFKETWPLEEISFADFQASEGGISILPYASSDLLFTAKVLEVDKDDFDTNAAKEYFYNVLNNKNSNLEEITYAYYGLAVLGEPVLNDINNFMTNQFLPPEYQLYLARAIDKLGATEYAVGIVKKILQGHGESVEPYLRINLGKTQDEITEYTYQAAVVMASAGLTQASQLFDYAYHHPAKDQLNNTEILAYVSRELPRLSGEPVSFNYVLDGKEKNVSLNNDEQESLSLTPEQIKNIQFKNISGQVGLIVTYQVPMDVKAEKTDKNLSIKRVYSVAGNDTNTFSENDIVKITIMPQIAAKAIDNEYQVTDFLPAGLKILSNTFYRGIGLDLMQQYPYEVNGQQIKFWSGKPAKAFNYYAVVTSKGTYTAEPVTLQGFVARDSQTFGEAQTITIK